MASYKSIRGIHYTYCCWDRRTGLIHHKELGVVDYYPPTTATTCDKLATMLEAWNFDDTYDPADSRDAKMEAMRETLYGLDEDWDVD